MDPKDFILGQSSHAAEWAYQSMTAAQLKSAKRNGFYPRRFSRSKEDVYQEDPGGFGYIVRFPVPYDFDLNEPVDLYADEREPAMDADFEAMWTDVQRDAADQYSNRVSKVKVLPNQAEVDLSNTPQVEEWVPLNKAYLRESKAVYVVKLLLGEEEDPTAQASADSARVASEFIRKKNPTRYLKHRSDLEAEQWVRAQKKAAGMAEAVTLPTGFTATRDGDEVEWRYDAAAQAYRFSKFWTDEWTGQRREGHNLGVQRVKPAEAEQWLQKEMRRWAGGGWTVKRIATSTMAEATTSKQNRYNPKGLVRDHRGNLLDKWGRKMEVDWDEFERRRVKTKDASEPYLKPPAQKNPLHNSTRPARS